MAKAPIVLMSELINESEYASKKQSVLDSVAYNPLDPDDLFCLKLQKLPILRDAEMIPVSEYESDMAELKKILTPTARDTVEALDMKLSKWPAMVKSGTVADAELFLKL